MDCDRVATDCGLSARKGSRDDEAIGDAEMDEVDCQPVLSAGESRFMVVGLLLPGSIVDLKGLGIAGEGGPISRAKPSFVYLYS